MARSIREWAEENPYKALGGATAALVGTGLLARYVSKKGGDNIVKKVTKSYTPKKGGDSVVKKVTKSYTPKKGGDSVVKKVTKSYTPKKGSDVKVVMTKKKIDKLNDRGDVFNPKYKDNPSYSGKEKLSSIQLNAFISEYIKLASGKE
jgi:hypothetical protein